MSFLSYFSSKHLVDQQRYLKWIVGMLSVAMCTTIFLQNNIHEEWVYVNQAIQILYHHNWLDTSYSRPPLFAWSIIGVSKVIGVSHVVAAARIVCILSFWSMAVILFSLVKTIEKDTLLAWYAVVALYSFEMIAKHAWLAYADPLFSVLIFAAVAWLWIGMVKHQSIYIYISLLALFLAIITKSFTALFVYGVSWWVLFFAYPNKRAMLYSFNAVLAYLGFILISFLFFYYNIGWFHSMYADIFSGEVVADITFSKRLYMMFVRWPFIVLDAMAPSLWVALFLLIFNKQVRFKSLSRHTLFLASLWIFSINLLPYWLSKHIVELRYLMPLLPFISIVSAFIVFNSGQSVRLLYCKVMMILSIILAVNFIWVPHWVYRYTINSTADRINQIVKEDSICVYGGDDSIFDSLTTQLRIRRYVLDQPNVLSCSSTGVTQEYVVARSKDQLKKYTSIKTFGVIGSFPHQSKNVYLLKHN